MNQHSREQSRSHYTITDYKAELFSYCDELTSHDTQEKVKRVKTLNRIRWQLDDNYVILEFILEKKINSIV